MNRIAYLVLAHTDPTQLNRLVNTLQYECDIFIHLDAKSKVKPFAELDWPENTRFLSRRLRVSWAGFSMVEATLELMRAALDSGDRYGHLVLLSGADYPIKPAERVFEYLDSQPKKNFMRLVSIHGPGPERYLSIRRKQIRRYWFKDTLSWVPFILPVKIIRKILEVAVHPFSKRPLKDIDHCFGSQWWALTRDCASYILDFVSTNRAFVRFYRHCFAPDEHFFHTIVATSPFFDTIDGYFNIVDRPPTPEKQTGNLHYIHRSLSKIFTEKDFPQLRESEKFFVRKVTTEDSSALLDMIDEKLLV